jgi:hypothetical protein
MQRLPSSRAAQPALVGLVLLSLAAPAGAGMRYTVTTESSRGERTAARVEAEGEAVRVEFRERGEAMFGRGDYLVTEDGGATIYWVEPRKRRFARVDFERLAQTLGRLLQGIPGVYWVRIEEPEVRKLFEEEAPPLLGLPTRHVRYLMTYRDRSRLTLPARRGVSSTRQETWNHVVEDVWLTGAVAAPRHDFWLRDRWRSGYEDLDRLLAAEAGMRQGFPLRIERVAVAATRDLEHTRVRLESDRHSVTQEVYLGDAAPRREIEYTRTVTEVSELEPTAEPIDVARFRPPADFKETAPRGER